MSVFLVILSVFVFACANHRVATLEGRVAGHGLVVQDAIAANGPLTQGGTQTQTLVIAITDQPNTCGYAKASQIPPNSMGFGLYVTRIGTKAPSPPVLAGTYHIGGPPTPDADGVLTIATASLSAYDASCADALNTAMAKAGTATAGTIVVSSITASRIIGHYDVHVGGDRLRGTFDAPICDFDFNVFANDPHHTCAR